jgi:hypothetical protein
MFSPGWLAGLVAIQQINFDRTPFARARQLTLCSVNLRQ